VGVSVKAMDTNKSNKAGKPQVQSVSTGKSTGKAANYFTEVKAEFGKITWTQKDELAVYTKIVVAATLVCGIGVYFVDLGIQAFLTGLEYSIRLVTG